MGLPDRLARASLRFGIGRFNTESEIDNAVHIVTGVVRQLRG
jgi:cysteine desulfurase